MARRDWLRFCAQRLTSIEVNATFYRLQDRRTFARWREETPPDFRFAVKANRYLTHVKRLLDPAEPIQQERERAEGRRGGRATPLQCASSSDIPLAVAPFFRIHRSAALLPAADYPPPRVFAPARDRLAASDYRE